MAIRVEALLHTRQGKRFVNFGNGVVNNLVNGVRRPCVASVDSNFDFDAKGYRAEVGVSQVKDLAMGLGLIALSQFFPPLAILGVKKLCDAGYDTIQAFRTLGNPFKDEEGRTPKTVQRLEEVADQVRNRPYVSLSLRRLS